jgi:hypothetical protein
MAAAGDTFPTKFRSRAGQQRPAGDPADRRSAGRLRPGKPVGPKQVRFGERVPVCPRPGVLTLLLAVTGIDGAPLAALVERPTHTLGLCLVATDELFTPSQTMRRTYPVPRILESDHRCSLILHRAGLLLLPARCNSLLLVANNSWQLNSATIASSTCPSTPIERCH